MGSPDPTSIGLVPASQVFVSSKCRANKNTPGLVNIDKHAGQAKIPEKKNQEIWDRMAQRVSETPPKTTRHQKGTLLGQENKQPFWYVAAAPAEVILLSSDLDAHGYKLWLR